MSDYLSLAATYTQLALAEILCTLMTSSPTIQALYVHKCDTFQKILRQTALGAAELLRQGLPKLHMSHLLQYYLLQLSLNKS